MNKHSCVILISAHKTFLSVFTNMAAMLDQNISEFVFLILVQLTPEFTQSCLSVNAGHKICNTKEYFLLLAYWCNYVDLPDLCKYSKFHEKSVLISAVSFSVSSKLMYYYLIFNKKNLKASNIVSISLITEAY